MSDVDFWVSMFRPRSKVWQRSTLKRLKNYPLDWNETDDERGRKILALKILLNYKNRQVN